MKIELEDKESEVIRHALEVYLSELRGEITKTEKHEWKAGLHQEEEIIKDVLSRMN